LILEVVYIFYPHLSSAGVAMIFIAIELKTGEFFEIVLYEKLSSGLGSG